MRRETLTDDVIQHLDPEDKPYRVFDLVDRGLCVTIHPKGSKRMYRRKGQAWEPLGAWPWFKCYQAIRAPGRYKKNGPRCGSRDLIGDWGLGDVAS